MDPDHPDAYYRLGFMYENDLLKKEDAIEFYEKQLAINPAHKDAMWRLGQLYRVLSRTDQAARTLSRLMQTQGTNQRQYMLELAEVYLERKDYKKAETLFETYIAGLNARERMPFEDISLLASEGETEAFRQATGRERQAFLNRFWKRRDPTPITEVNERRVEHFRRVAYAREHFGSAIFPWDRRGEIYVRYGTPSHKSASANRQRESHPEDWAIKQRLLDRVDWAAEILLSDYAASDGDSLTHRGAGAERAQRQLDRQFQRLYSRSSERNQKSEQIRKRAESAMAVGGLGIFLGRPIFPIQDRRAWEYWIYPGLGEGVEIVFRQMPGAPDGVFDYAVLPAKMATKMRHLWGPLIPEQIISQAPQRDLCTGISRRTAVLCGLSRHISRTGRQHARGDLLRISRFRIDARWRRCSDKPGCRSLQCKRRSGIQSSKTSSTAGRWKNRDHSRYNRTGCKTWIVLPRCAGH